MNPVINLKKLNKDTMSMRERKNSVFVVLLCPRKRKMGKREELEEREKGREDREHRKEEHDGLVEENMF